MSEYCPKCGETISEDDSRMCAKCQAESSFAAPTGLACQWFAHEVITGKRLIKTTCGNLMDAAIEEYGFKFCGNCGKPISWQANAGDERLPAKNL